MTCEKPENMRARAERNGYKNGTQYGSLESQVMYDPRLKELLPTPSARDWKGKTNPGEVKKGSGCIYGETLPDAVERLAVRMLPTPRANEVNDVELTAELGARNKSNLEESVAKALHKCCPENDGKGFRLSPLFTEEMMGFPLMWTTLPFLSPSGEPSR